MATEVRREHVVSEDEDDEEPMPFMWIEGDSLAPPCQSEREVISEVLALADLKSGDILYDLGSGDGRICITAAKKYGVKASGIEIEEFLIERFRKRISAEGLEDQVTAIHGDITKVDYADATVLTIYLLPEAIALIRDQLIHMLERGCRIVCNTWGIKGIPATREQTCGAYNNVALYLYTSAALQSIQQQQ